MLKSNVSDLDVGDVLLRSDKRIDPPDKLCWIILKKKIINSDRYEFLVFGGNGEQLRIITMGFSKAAAFTHLEREFYAG